MRKKIFTFLLALATSVGLMWAQNPSGSCGTNLSWEFNPATGALTITGSGAMTDWASASSRPWHSYQSDITSLSLPEGLTYIGRSAFQECQMTSVELPNSLEEIGRAAFCACGLTSVTIPDNVHTIGWSAFASCQNLSTITIGSGVTSIGYFAFSNLMIEPWPSRKLESVTCYATTPPTCDYDESFSELWNKEQVPLYVPAESVDAYKAAEDWKDFDVQAISGGSTPAVTAARFVYNYDCQRSPAYPQAGSPCTLSGFSDPLVGYTGIGISNKALGPWKLEFVGYYTPSNHYDCEYRVISAVNSYYPTLSDEEKQAKCLEVPIFRLWQYNLAAKEYQHASYGIICAYAGEANAQDHGALFISSESWGCFLTGHQHTSSFQISCENDLTTGMADLVAAASASDPDLDAIQPIIVSIDAIGTVELSEHCKYYIEGSRAAYNALTDEQKAQVTNYSTLTNAETQWAALAAAAQPYADAVIALINAIPNPVVYTQDCKDKIDAAQAAYDALTDGQKILVSNYETLKNAPSDLIKAAPYVHILFKANGNEKKVENVTLPREFTEAEMKTILKELYGVEGDYDMYAYYNSNADAVNISYDEWTIYPFMGKVNVHGNMDKYDPQTGYEWIDFSLEISLELPPFGSAPASTVVEIGDPNNASQIETFLTNNNGQTIDELIINRPVLNNMYNTLCLPFDMNAAQIAASSLNGVEIREFTGASVEGTTLNLSVGDPVNAVVAGRPYFVKYSAASQLDNLHFEDVTINNALLDNMAVTFDGVTFKGTFTPFVMPNGLNFQGGYLFLGQNNQLFWPNTSNPLKPFRAYFYVNVESSTPGNAPKYRGMPARIVEGKNVATGVENAQSANQSTKVIVNGQLIIIKNDVRYNAQGQIVK